VPPPPWPPSPPPPLPPPPLLPPLLPPLRLRAVIAAARDSGCTTCPSCSGVRCALVHMYATYLSPFSEINKQCRGHTSRALAGKVAANLLPVSRSDYSRPHELAPFNIVLTSGSIVRRSRTSNSRRQQPDYSRVCKSGR
jgi:hypothetical protein